MQAMLDMARLVTDQPLVEGMTFSGTITSSGNAFSLNGHCNLGNSFNLNGENKNTITNNNMKVTDLEVYKVIGKICYYY